MVNYLDIHIVFYIKFFYKQTYLQYLHYLQVGLHVGVVAFSANHVRAAEPDSRDQRSVVLRQWSVEEVVILFV